MPRPEGSRIGNRAGLFYGFALPIWFGKLVRVARTVPRCQPRTYSAGNDALLATAHG